MSYKFFCLLFLLVFPFLMGCGEEENLSDEPLSELIIGSWRCIEEEIIGTVMYPMNGEIVTAKMDWTLTFYAAGDFDFIVGVSMALNGEPFADVKAITKGRYEAFKETIAFRPGESQLLVSPADFKPFVEAAMGAEIEQMENLWTGTSKASVKGNRLILDEERWLKI